jgi:hypothetical protein
MQVMMNGYRGLSLLLVLNWDRLLSIAIIMVALMTAGWIGSEIAAR